LGIILLAFAFGINISGNRLIGLSATITSLIKITGIAFIAIAGLWVAGFSFGGVIGGSSSYGTDSTIGVFASIALTILAFKGFTTITNSGSEITKPNVNVGRAIIISISICAVVYFLVAWAVSANLGLEEIIKAKDYALAEAAKPVFGNSGVWVTVFLAIVATISGIIASVFAVSRMLAMLTDMHLIPHKHFGMPGSIQKHTLVYTIVIAMVLTIFFDLSRIASMGAIFYLVMDIAIHWGVFRYLKKDIDANLYIIVLAIVFDLIVLGAFLWIKVTTDYMIAILSIGLILLVFIGEKLFLRQISDN
jgi:amino acid transporter